MYNVINSNEFQQNEGGRYSYFQVRSLVLWFSRYVFVFGVAGFALAYNLSNIWRFLIYLLTTTFLATYLYLYGADLLQKTPTFIVGRITKEIRKFRGPTHYDVVVEGSTLRIRALNKIQWQDMQAGMKYKIYYSPRTKWILSYNQLTDAHP